MRRQLIARLLLSGLTAGSLAACGGGGGNSSSTDHNPPPTVLTGKFIDKEVENIGYWTETRNGVTNSAGEFKYLDGETVVFFIGDLELPPVEAKPIVTPLEIAQTDDVNNRIVINIARLLQSLDEDHDPSNGITIPPTDGLIVAPLNFDQPVEQFAELPEVVNLVSSAGNTLESAENSIAHLNNSLSALDKDIIGAWKLDNRPELLVFRADGSYMHGAIGDPDGEGQLGIELGTYTWDARESRLRPTTCPSIDQNGGSGLSDGCPNKVPRLSSLEIK